MSESFFFSHLNFLVAFLYQIEKFDKIFIFQKFTEVVEKVDCRFFRVCVISGSVCRESIDFYYIFGEYYISPFISAKNYKNPSRTYENIKFFVPHLKNQKYCSKKSTVLIKHYRIKCSAELRTSGHDFS